VKQYINDQRAIFGAVCHRPVLMLIFYLLHIFDFHYHPINRRNRFSGKERGLVKKAMMEELESYQDRPLIH